METADQNSSWPRSSDAQASVDKVADKADAAIDRAAETATDVVEKARAMTDRIAASAHAAVDKAASAAGPAVEWSVKQGSNLRRQQQRATETTVTYISENPLKSIGICFGVGVVVGLLVRRNL